MSRVYPRFCGNIHNRCENPEPNPEHTFAIMFTSLEYNSPILANNAVRQKILLVVDPLCILTQFISCLIQME